MSVVIGVLTIDLKSNIAEFSEGMDKAAHISARTANDIKKSFEKLAAVGIAMGTAIAAGTGEIVKQSVEAIVGLTHMSQAAGTTIDQLSALNYAAQRVGVPTELLVKGLEKLAQASFKAQNGNVQLANIFQRLGIHVTDSNGHLKDSGTLFSEIAPKFSAMADGAGKTALAMQLFGKGGAVMIPLMNEWGAHMEELTANARKFGLILGPEVSERALRFHETLNNLKAAAFGFGLQLTAAALPALENFAKKLEEVAVRANIPELAKAFGEKLSTALNILGNSLDFVLQHAKALEITLASLAALKGINFAIPLVKQLSKGGLGNVGEAIEKLTIGLLGLKNVLPFLGGLARSFNLMFDGIRLVAMESGIASAALYGLGGALNFIKAHPVGLALTAITSLMYAFRNATFTAKGQVYEFSDAYSALWQILTFGERKGETKFTEVLARVRRERLGLDQPIGPEIGMHNLPAAPKNVFDTSGLGPAKKDVYGEEIKKLDLAIITTAQYISLLGAEPTKILAVKAAHDAEAIILQLNSQRKAEHLRLLSDEEKQRIKTHVAERDELTALEALGNELVSQQRSTELATTQTSLLAVAQLKGSEAVRQAAIENAILGATYKKLGADTPEAARQVAKLRELLTAKSNVDVIDEANKQIYALGEEVTMRKYVTDATLQGVEAQRANAIAAKTYKIDQQIAATDSVQAKEALEKQRQAIVDLARAEFAEADAKRAMSLASPLVTMNNELEALQKAVDILPRLSGGTIDYASRLKIAAEQQDLFNKATDETVNLLLRFGTARDGVTAFFLEMQKQAKSSASIVYDALHSAFEKLSDNLTELFTGGKTSFGKMFQDIGKQMVNSQIKSALQTGLGKLGDMFGINLGSALAGKPDGSSAAAALWVRMAGPGGGMPGMPSIPGMPTGTSGGVFGGGSLGGGVFSLLENMAPQLSAEMSGMGAAAGNAAFGSWSGFADSLASSGAAFAEGGMPSPGSAYLVGEQGPEIRLASGEIMSNTASRRMLAGSADVHNYTIDARGTDPVLVEQRVRSAIVAAHRDAITTSVNIGQENLKRSPQK